MPVFHFFSQKGMKLKRKLGCSSGVGAKQEEVVLGGERRNGREKEMHG